jgi:hypothetical protein
MTSVFIRRISIFLVTPVVFVLVTPLVALILFPNPLVSLDFPGTFGLSYLWASPPSFITGLMAGILLYGSGAYWPNLFSKTMKAVLVGVSASLLAGCISRPVYSGIWNDSTWMTGVYVQMFTGYAVSGALGGFWAHHVTSGRDVVRDV